MAESEKIKHGTSSQFAFNTGIPQILRYYCEYHPRSMTGIINVTSAIWNVLRSNQSVTDRKDYSGFMDIYPSNESKFLSVIMDFYP